MGVCNAKKENKPNQSNKPNKPNATDDFSVPVCDSPKVNNRYYFVAKFNKAQTYQSKEIEDQCSIERNLQKIISNRSGDDVFVIQFQPSQVISLDIMNQEMNSSFKTKTIRKPQKLFGRHNINLLDSFEIISIIK